MALLKTLINDKGIQTKYHKINSVIVYPTYAIINIDSYANEEYRKLEKEFYDVIDRIDEIQKKLDSIPEFIMGKDEKDDEIIVEDNRDMVSDLRAEMELLTNSKNTDNSHLSVDSHTISVPFNSSIDNWGFAQIYSIIKKLELFSNSEDC
jgi:peptide subunit release factor RF-3